MKISGQLQNQCFLGLRVMIKKDYVCIQAKWFIGLGGSLKRLGVVLLPLDGMLLHRRVTPLFKFTEPIYTPGWRGTVREKCLPFLREQLFDYGASRGVKKTRASSVIAFNKVIFKLFFQLLC